MKREIPLIITFLCGFVFMTAYYVPRFDEVLNFFDSSFMILAVFAYVLGTGSLLIVNGNKIAKAAPGWGYNAVLVISFFVTLLFGVFGGISEGSVFDWIFTYIFNPLSSTMFSLLAFFIASAAFRAFKAKTLEATLLLVTAFIVMVGRVPLGEFAWNMVGLDHIIPMNDLIDRWIMGAFNTAGQRAIMIGSAIGLISVSLKILLGIERSYLGGE